MRVGFTGTTGFNYSLQASANLTNWLTIATNLSGVPDAVVKEYMAITGLKAEE